MLSAAITTDGSVMLSRSAEREDGPAAHPVPGGIILQE